MQVHYSRCFVSGYAPFVVEYATAGNGHVEQIRRHAYLRSRRSRRFLFCNRNLQHMHAACLIGKQRAWLVV
jgi:hypothetical protein